MIMMTKWPTNIQILWLLSKNWPISGNTTWREKGKQFRHGLTPLPFSGNAWMKTFFCIDDFPYGKLQGVVVAQVLVQVGTFPNCLLHLKIDSIAVSVFEVILVQFYKYWILESETSRLINLKISYFALSNLTCILLALSLTQNLCKSGSVSSSCSIIPSSLRAMVEPRCLCSKCRTKGVQRCKVQYLMIW